MAMSATTLHSSLMPVSPSPWLACRAVRRDSAAALRSATAWQRRLDH